MNFTQFGKGLAKSSFSNILEPSVLSFARNSAIGAGLGAGISWAGGGDPVEGAQAGGALAALGTAGVFGLKAIGAGLRSAGMKVPKMGMKISGEGLRNIDYKNLGSNILEKTLKGGAGAFNALNRGMSVAGYLMPTKTAGFALGAAGGLGVAAYGAGKAVLGELSQGSMSPYGDTASLLKSPGVLATNQAVSIASGGVAGGLVGLAVGGLSGKSKAVAGSIGALAGGGIGLGLAGSGHSLSLMAANKMHNYDQRATSQRKFDKNGGMNGPMSFRSGSRVSGGHLGATGDLALSLHANRRG